MYVDRIHLYGHLTPPEVKVSSLVGDCRASITCGLETVLIALSTRAQMIDLAQQILNGVQDLDLADQAAKEAPAAQCPPAPEAVP